MPFSHRNKRGREHSTFPATRQATRIYHNQMRALPRGGMPCVSDYGNEVCARIAHRRNFSGIVLFAAKRRVAGWGDCGKRVDNRSRSPGGRPVPKEADDRPKSTVPQMPNSQWPCSLPCKPASGLVDSDTIQAFMGAGSWKLEAGSWEGEEGDRGGEGARC